MEQQDQIKQVAKKVLQANLANIANKVKEGKTLNKEERLMFEEFTKVEAPELEKTATLTEMAERLGISLRTIQRWKKKYADAPQGLVVSEWVAFQNLIEGPREEENLAAKKAKTEIRKNELACEKLQLEVSRLKGELVAREEVKADGARLGALIKASFSKLEKELSGRLEGKTPEERQVEIRKAVAESISIIIKELKETDALK